MPMTCFANGTGIYEVGPGGTCELSDSVTGKSALLAAYYILGACILHFGTRQMMARGKRRRAEEDGTKQKIPGEPYRHTGNLRKPPET